MSSADFAVYAASGLATGLGAALAIRERAHRPIAALLVLGIVADVVQRVVRPLYAGAPRPLEGAARVWGHLGQAAFACYPWAVLAVALVVLSTRRAWLVGAAWVAYEALLVLGYRALGLREHRLGLTYLAAQVLLVAAMVGVAVPWWRSWRRARHDVRAETALALAACAVEAIILAGPMLFGRPWEHWAREARPPYALFYVIAILIQGAELWISRRSVK